MNKKDSGTVGIIVGGGPAPGINGVISSATIEAINQGKKVIGIKGGFKPLFEGRTDCALPLTISDVSRIHSQGGSILRTSRDFPDKVKEKFKVLMSTLKQARHQPSGYCRRRGHAFYGQLDWAGIQGGHECCPCPKNY